MASAAGIAGVRATLDLGSKSFKCVQCGEPDSARITRHSKVGRRAVKLTRNARALSEVPRREKTKGAPQRNAGALSIRALEGSRWHQGCVGPQVMGFECW